MSSCETLSSSQPQKPRLISSWLLNVLVSVIVVAILAAIFFPMLHHGARRGRLSCASNLKQIGLAMMQYTQEYDEQFPQRTTSVKPNGEIVSGAICLIRI